MVLVLPYLAMVDSKVEMQKERTSTDEPRVEVYTVKAEDGAVDAVFGEVGEGGTNYNTVSSTAAPDLCCC